MTSAIKDFIPDLMLGSGAFHALDTDAALPDALAHESHECDDRPGRAAPPFAPFGGLAGETDGVAPQTRPRAPTCGGRNGDAQVRDRGFD
jgi:hypothetical protein